MAGILNAASRGVYTDKQQQDWVYFQDSDASGIFYVVPTAGLAIANGKRMFHLTVYEDGGGAYVSALCQITTALVPPDEVIQSTIAAALQAKGVRSPTYQSMPYVDLGNGPDRNTALLGFADTTGTVSRSLNSSPSTSGDQRATFNITNLNESEANFLKSYFGTAAAIGTVTVGYQLTVMAHMDGVTARVQFDSSKAYEYQRTFEWVSSSD